MLNDIQKVMAHHHDGPALFTAVAGSGKSTGIVHNLEQKAKMGIDLHRVIVTTFNKDAANQIRMRVEPFYGSYLDAAPINTSHAIFYRILREQGRFANKVTTEIEAKRDVKRAIGKQYRPGDDALYLGAISYLKNHLCWHENIEKTDVYLRYMAMRSYITGLGLDEDLFGLVWERYEAEKIKREQMDMDDMLFKAYVLFKQRDDILSYYQRKYQYLVVDEYQDTNEAQYQLFKMLADVHQNIMVVGDDDQAIYGFRGSRPEYIRKFKEEYRGAVHETLEENYRSQAGIASAANRLISVNEDRYKKTIQPIKPFKVKPFIVEQKDTLSEANFIADCVEGTSFTLDEVAILTRTNSQQCWIEEVFLEREIPYKIVENTPFYSRKEIMAMLNYLKLSSERVPDVKLIKEIANKPYRKLGNDVINGWQSLDDVSANWQGQRLFQDIMFLKNVFDRRPSLDLLMTYIIETPIMLGIWARELASLQSDSNAYGNLMNLVTIAQKYTFDSFMEKVEQAAKTIEKNKTIKNKVAISTVHRAKGLEWEEVYIPGCNQGVMPHKSSTDLEEERRLMYVAITRAKHFLTISHIQVNLEGESQEPSQFLKEMEDTIEYDKPTEETE